MSKILYNVTVKVNLEIHEEWKKWMQEKHIEDVLKTNCFSECRMSRLLSQDEEDGITYSLQYLSPSMKKLHEYQVSFAQKLQKEHRDLFQDQVVAFRTMMEVIDEFKQK